MIFPSVKFHILKQYIEDQGILHFNNSKANVTLSLPVKFKRLNLVPVETKFWTLLMGNYVIISSNEMETTRVGEV